MHACILHLQKGCMYLYKQNDKIIKPATPWKCVVYIQNLSFYFLLKAVCLYGHTFQKTSRPSVSKCFPRGQFFLSLVDLKAAVQSTAPYFPAHTHRSMSSSIIHSYTVSDAALLHVLGICLHRWTRVSFVSILSIYVEFNGNKPKWSWSILYKLILNDLVEFRPRLR